MKDLDREPRWRNDSLLIKAVKSHQRDTVSPYQTFANRNRWPNEMGIHTGIPSQLNTTATIKVHGGTYLEHRSRNPCFKRA